MKTKRVLLSTMIILLAVGWQVPVQAQDIPVNYTQNPNFEHELNSIFWYGGWDAVNGSNGTANFPWMYLTDGESHSGNWSLYFFSQWEYIWVSYPVRGHEQKRMKVSFWYKGSLQYFNNYIYRDVGMTEEDLHPSLAEYVGADSAWHQFDGQDALRFDFGGPNDSTADWTYFEHVWDMPGTIPGWGNTVMWYADVPEAWVDDMYYGEWFDAQYSGEEPFGFINGDFEKTELNTEWLVNVASWDNYFVNSDFLSWTENNTPDPGLQSLRLLDYWEVFPDTNDVVEPYDSIDQDTTFQDKNVTYYLPALNAEGKNMELSFFHKGNEATMDLEFYDDYGVTTDDFPLPAGATLYADTANPVYELDTNWIMSVANDTFTVADQGDYTDVIEFQIDTAMYFPTEILLMQDFDDEADQTLGGGSWLWSGGGNYGYNDWAAGTVNDEAWSSPEALWLPGDPDWGGAEGYFDVVDDTNYIIEFMYIGQVQFILNLGATKYNLVDDVDGIVPADAVADANTLTWMLDSKYWKKFRFEYMQGSWLADSSLNDTVSVAYDLIGTYDAADNGYVDDVLIALGRDTMPNIIDTNFVVVLVDGDTTYTPDIDTVGISYNQVGARFMLPAAADWTEFKLNWTNPSTDIGGTLTMMLDNDAGDSPIWITQANPEIDDAHADITFFDDFVYQVLGGTSVKSITVKDLHVYPNPAVDMLYLSLDIPLEKVEMFNVMGQMVKVLNNPERKFNVSDLSSGIYLIHATDEEGTLHEAKFLKK
jgi:hypothetical protein